MNDIVYFLVFVVIFFLQVYTEKKLWGSYFTPVIILFFPYAVLPAIKILFLNCYGFVVFKNSFFIYIISFQLISSVISFFIANFLYLNQKVKVSSEYYLLEKHELEREKNLLVFIATFLSLILIYGAITNLYKVGGISKIYLDTFTMSFNSGITGHSLVFATPILSLIIGISNKKDKLLILLGLLLFSMFILYQSKSTLLFAIIPGFILRFMLRRGMKLLVILFSLPLFGFIFYIGIYLISIDPHNRFTFKEEFDFLFRHFFDYLYSGILGFNQMLETKLIDKGSVEVLFAPFLNVFKFLTFQNDFVNIINKEKVVIDTYNGFSTNVFGYFGGLFYNTGIYLSFAFHTLYITLSYFVLIAYFSTRSIFVLIYYLLLCCLFFLGWFDFYFNNLLIIEVVIMLLIFDVLLKNWKIVRLK